MDSPRSRAEHSRRNTSCGEEKVGIRGERKTRRKETPSIPTHLDFFTNDHPLTVRPTKHHVSYVKRTPAAN